jgi:hypothetical protein
MDAISLRKKQTDWTAEREMEIKVEISALLVFGFFPSG